MEYLKTIRRAYDYTLLRYNGGDLQVKSLVDDLKRVVEDLEAHQSFINKEVSK